MNLALSRTVMVSALVFGFAGLANAQTCTPTFLGSYDTPGNALALTAVGTTVYVADRTQGLHIIDASDPTTPVLLGTYNAPGGDPDSLFYYDVEVEGSTAYAINSSYGLVVIDVSDPTAPALLSELPYLGSARGMILDGTTVYVANRTEGLRIIDVSDPLAPAILGTLPSSDAWDVAIVGSIAYVADRLDGLLAIDVSDPTLPSLLSVTATVGRALGVAARDTTVYVATNIPSGGDGEFLIFDVANPAAPILVGTQVVPLNTFRPEVVGNTAYVTQNISDGALQIIDISDPSMPNLVAVADPPGTLGTTRVVTVVDTVAYVSTDSGLRIFEVGSCHDTDVDGLVDSEEITLGTDPSNPDTDDDGLFDGTEVDIADGGSCPDPLDADSDNDNLNDGDEVALGTDSCNGDTDDDGIPDDIDPLPLDPGGTSGFIESALRVICDDVGALDLSVFDAPNNNARKGRRNAICNKLNAAANATAAGGFQGAIDQLTSLLAKLDGDPQPKDWMIDSGERTSLRSDIEDLTTLLQFLL